jgi:hypothetical protein
LNGAAVKMDVKNVHDMTVTAGKNLTLVANRSPVACPMPKWETS